MARIRTIKPEFWTSEQVVSCSPTARLLFIGLWNFSDDNGIHSASEMRAKMEIFPMDSYTLDDIQNWINELIANNLLHAYEVNGEGYWQVTGWKKHQRIDRPTYRFPEPHEASLDMQQSFDDNSTNDSRLPIEPSATEWNGKDRSGKEENICAVKTAPNGISTEPSIASTINPTADETEVFNYWQEVMRHPKAKLDKNRLTKIRQALALGYSVDDLKQAIDGCSLTPFNMGKNKDGQRNDKLVLILDNADQIDRFMANATSPPSGNCLSSFEPDPSIGAL